MADTADRPFNARAELRLIERAIRDGWATPPAARAAAMERVGSILTDPTTSGRLALSAVRVLVLADRVTLGLLPPDRPRPETRRRRRPRAR